jgi:ubiquinone/menaquinone biosynthesis C-methylase UbiE
MRWESYKSDLIELAGFAPGGTALADKLVESLMLEPGLHVLDICTGQGVLASIVASEFDVEVTCLALDDRTESSAHAAAAALGVSGRVKVVTGLPAAIPLPAESFQRVYCLAHPYPHAASPGVVREIYRILAADGIIGLAGPAALSNETPGYMREALRELEGVTLRTPAYTALLFAREGFYIATAEYFSESFDHWQEWLRHAPPEIASDAMRKAVEEDGGRWLALGLMILRKPPKPEWAV